MRFGRYLDIRGEGRLGVVLNPEISTAAPRFGARQFTKEQSMSNIVYIVGLVVIVVALMSYFGLR
jgi:hypothetical protein